MTFDDLTSPAPTYGQITRRELSTFSTSFFRTDTKMQEKKSALVHKVLEAMDSKSAKVVKYMPAQLENLPHHLRKRAIQILLDDPSAGRTGRPLEISRMRYALIASFKKILR